MSVEFAMGKIKDCKKYIGMTVLSALCFFASGNEAQAQNNDNLYPFHNTQQ